MEAISGLIKVERSVDFHATGDIKVEQEINDYIGFFDEQRTAYSPERTAPKQFRKQFVPTCLC